ncbi:MAG: transposase [Myxococcales bacterium]|nr:transposase [Myxococcales bacterium]
MGSAKLRKVWALLRREYGLRVGLKRVYALMRDAELLLRASRRDAGTSVGFEKAS